MMGPGLSSSGEKKSGNGRNGDEERRRNHGFNGDNVLKVRDDDGFQIEERIP